MSPWIHEQEAIQELLEVFHQVSEWDEMPVIRIPVGEVKLGMIDLDGDVCIAARLDGDHRTQSEVIITYYDSSTKLIAEYGAQGTIEILSTNLFDLEVDEVPL